MRKIGVLGLVRDMGAGNMVAPILTELERRGHSVMLLAEESGQAKNCLKVPFSVVGDEEALRQQFFLRKPHVVITGLTQFRHLETCLDRMARESGTSVVHVEEYWSVHGHAPHAPDLYITIDALAKRLIREAHPHVPVIAAGLGGVMPIVPRPEMVAVCDRIRNTTNGVVLVYPDGGQMCELALPLLVQSILLTRTHITLVPRFHPSSKMTQHPSGGTCEEWCHAQLEPLRVCGKVVDIIGITDEVIEAADGVVSSFSTTLMRPARVGKLALTLWDETNHVLFKGSTGLDKTPLMMDGRFPVLTNPEPLDPYLVASHPIYALEPFNPSIAADAVYVLVA